MPNIAIYLDSNPDTDGPGDISDHHQASWTLQDVIGKKEWNGKCLLGMTYTYDWGDNWDHQINLLGRDDPNLHETLEGDGMGPFMCVNGEGYPCAEDCSSTEG